MVSGFIAGLGETSRVIHSIYIVFGVIILFKGAFSR